jgi:hypothetical protein
VARALVIAGVAHVCILSPGMEALEQRGWLTASGPDAFRSKIEELVQRGEPADSQRQKAKGLLRRGSNSGSLEGSRHE